MSSTGEITVQRMQPPQQTAFIFSYLTDLYFEYSIILIKDDLNY